jgi:hypothetical protein
MARTSATGTVRVVMSSSSSGLRKNRRRRREIRHAEEDQPVAETGRRVEPRPPFNPVNDPPLLAPRRAASSADSPSSSRPGNSQISDPAALAFTMMTRPS